MEVRKGKQKEMSEMTLIRANMRMRNVALPSCAFSASQSSTPPTSPGFFLCASLVFNVSVSECVGGIYVYVCMCMCGRVGLHVRACISLSPSSPYSCSFSLHASIFVIGDQRSFISHPGMNRAWNSISFIHGSAHTRTIRV